MSTADGYKSKIFKKYLVQEMNKYTSMDKQGSIYMQLLQEMNISIFVNFLSKCCKQITSGKLTL